MEDYDKPIKIERPFTPGRGYKYLDPDTNIEQFSPATVAFSAIAGGARALEYLGRLVERPETIPDGFKRCAKKDCQCVKHESMFYWMDRLHTRRDSWCIECRRLESRLKYHGQKFTKRMNFFHNVA